MFHHTIKQLEEKNVANEICQMVWSDRMDLVAYANIKGEVFLHRLNWAKAWNLNPPQEGLSVKGISWRPDGKILAIVYSNGETILTNVENKDLLFHVQPFEGEVSCISWQQEKREHKSKEAINNVSDDDDNEDLDMKDDNDYVKYIDLSKKYLPDTPATASLEPQPNDDEKKLLHDQNELNLLLIGTKEGQLHIRVFGCYTFALLDLSKQLDIKVSVENIHISEDLSKMYVTVKEDKTNQVKIVVVDSYILKTHKKEIFAIALKYIRLMDLLTYLSDTITNITETWESILLEIDNKLSNYAKKVPEGGVTADFLDLLMFGICSDEMEEFLTHDLTKKGLEKFGQTIEMSYANIQKLLLKNVSKYGQNITYHLAELRGMARFKYRYKIFGLDEYFITEAIGCNGSFLIKSGEMQQIINHSVINYKAFFRWLYTAIMHLMDEPIPSDIHKMTQQDLAYITEFLQNFDKIGSKKDDDILIESNVDDSNEKEGTSQSKNDNKNDSKSEKGFTMERLGQYLVDAPLTIPPDMSGNLWTQFLSQRECLSKRPTILKHHVNKSLIQQFKMLKKNVENIFDSPRSVVREFVTTNVLNCFGCDDILRMSSVNLNKDKVLVSFVQNYHIFLVEVHHHSKITRIGKVKFTKLDGSEDLYKVLDVKFYSNSILSVLLNQEPNSAVLLQLSLPMTLMHLAKIDLNAKNINVPEINGSEILPKLYKNIENFVGNSFAVSGSRRVCLVLHENKRKVRLFEMEGEEEDEEDVDMSVCF